MNTTPTAEQVEELANRLSAVQAQLDEAEALIRYLRERGVIVNNEVRHRDVRLADAATKIAQLESSIVNLTKQLIELEPATCLRTVARGPRSDPVDELTAGMPADGPPGVTPAELIAALTEAP